MIGRFSERRQLDKLYDSDRSEFVAVYGRRRVGKTCLVREHFKDKFAFWHTGISPYDRDRTNLLQDQLEAFHTNLLRYGFRDSESPKSWMQAFRMLSRLIEDKNSPDKKIIFIDEMPWMDTARSRFIPAFENFWNDWASRRNDILLIVCGSATSWIEDNLINNKGGLYGRLTHKIHLRPLSVSESALFFKEKRIKLSDYEIAVAYMVFGGIPYYMEFLDGSQSLAHNIDRLFFAESPVLEDEFDLLFGSLFTNPEQHKSIVRLLQTKHSGFTRQEISEKTGIENGGGLTKQLRSLRASDFITDYIPFGDSKRKVHYKLTDSFCRFYLQFIEKKKVTDVHFWTNNIKSPALSSWKGIAFEELCFSNIQGIKQALGIGGVSSEVSGFVIRGDEEKEGSQIDLVIDRADNVVNLCEMKFYNDNFSVSKEYDRKLNRRLNSVQDSLPRRKIVRMTLVTTFGLSQNEYSGVFQNVVTLENLMSVQ